MTKSKSEIINKLATYFGGERNPEWEKWPVYKLLSTLDEFKEAKRAQVLSEDFSSRITGTIKH
jgi:hypothetical protein